MATIYTGLHFAIAGGTYRAFPASEADFTNWATRKVSLTDAGAVGKYSGSLDDTYGLLWMVFASDTTPTTFAQAVAQIDLGLTDSLVDKINLIGSLGATVPVRYVGTGIQLYIGETQAVDITTTNDLSAKTLVVEFDGSDQSQVASIADGAITKTTTTISFAATTTMTAKPQTLSYAVRDTTSKEVYVYGKCSVDYQPLP